MNILLDSNRWKESGRLADRDILIPLTVFLIFLILSALAMAVVCIREAILTPGFL